MGKFKSIKIKLPKIKTRGVKLPPNKTIKSDKEYDRKKLKKKLVKDLND